MLDQERVPLTNSHTSKKTSYVHLKGIICTLLLLQSTFHTIVRAKYKRSLCNTTLLIYTELCKLIISIGLTVTVHKSFVELNSFQAWLRVLPLGITFTLMNYISLYCTELVTASTFSMIMQLKLVFTYGFSVMFKVDTCNYQKVVSILTISAGTAAIISQTNHVERKDYSSMFALLGLVVETILSGLSTVYMKSVLQDSNIWERNVQIASIILIVCTLRHIYSQGECASIYSAGIVDASIIILGAIGGILVALTIKFVGGVEKCVTTCTSVVLTCFLEALIWSEVFNTTQELVSFIVILAVLQFHNG